MKYSFRKTIYASSIIFKSSSNSLRTSINNWLDFLEIKDEKITKIYQRYVEEETQEDLTKLLPSGGEVKPDQRMGYVSSVEDARKKLEEVWKKPFKNNKEG